MTASIVNVYEGRPDTPVGQEITADVDPYVVSEFTAPTAEIGAAVGDECSSAGVECHAWACAAEIRHHAFKRNLFWTK